MCSVSPLRLQYPQNQIDTYGKGETELKEGMKRLGYKYNKELKGIGKDESGKYYKGGYEGVKLKEFEKDENTEEP